MSQKLILIGAGQFGEIAYEYFTHDSEYDVVAFAVERDYITDTFIFGVPVVPFEEITGHFAPQEHSFYAAIVFNKLNRIRTRMYERAKSLGYTPASYISSRAFVWHRDRVGEHCFIFEDNTVQPFVTIGNNVILWSGNHIGHHSTIHDNNFISSHVVISGSCDIGNNCFFGVNSTIGDEVTIGADCLIGAGAMITRDVQENTLMKGQRSETHKVTARTYFKVDD